MARFQLQVASGLYWSSIWKALYMQDVWMGLIKPFVLGFVIGWLFRAFLKTMVFLGLVVCGALWLLSHFGILHITSAQVDAIRERSAEAAGWLQRHAAELKEIAVSHLPSTGGGTLGIFLGFHRR